MTHHPFLPTTECQYGRHLNSEDLRQIARECVKAVSRRFVSYELLPFVIGYVMTLHSWKRTLHGWTAEGKMCFCRSITALISRSFCDSKINIYIYWLSRLWIYHYFEYVDCNIWLLCLSVLLSSPLQCPYLEIAIAEKLVCWQIREWYTRTCLPSIWYLCSRISQKKKGKGTHRQL